jgi:transposase
MPWKEVSVMEQKEEFILLWQTGSYSVTALSEMFSISRPTAYKYIERFKRFGLPGLQELSRSPKTIANKTHPRIEEEIIKLRKQHPRWGGEKIQVLLEHQFPTTKIPHVSTVNLILKRNGLVRKKKKRKK